ncbi:MAG: YHS domain-containing (seleno)protein [Cyclobacteriaceae bacterium]
MILIMLLLALSDQQPSDLNIDKAGLALDGYDAVSYFLGEPKEGTKFIKTTYERVTYYFSSEKNKQVFLSDPDKYLPQYGGWCAYAMGLNSEKVKVDPETFKIVGGKLYLFYNFWGTNTLKPWNENEAALMEGADKNWKKIVE